MTNFRILFVLFAVCVSVVLYVGCDSGTAVVKDKQKEKEEQGVEEQASIDTENKKKQEEREKELPLIDLAAEPIDLAADGDKLRDDNAKRREVQKVVAVINDIYGIYCETADPEVCGQKIREELENVSVLNCPEDFATHFIKWRTFLFEGLDMRVQYVKEKGLPDEVKESLLIQKILPSNKKFNELVHRYGGKLNIAKSISAVPKQNAPIDVEDIISEWRNNPIVAELMYKGVTMNVSGAVTGVGLEGKDGHNDQEITFTGSPENYVPFIQLYDRSEIEYIHRYKGYNLSIIGRNTIQVRCYFPAKDKSQLMNIRKEQPVTVKGTINFYRISTTTTRNFIAVEKCTMMQQGKAPANDVPPADRNSGNTAERRRPFPKNQ